MKKSMFKDILITGFAMFAIFFGSGNLIFPPQVGLLSGEHVFWAIGGLQLLAIGVVGEYIGKIYLETKERPKYIIETVLDD